MHVYAICQCKCIYECYCLKFMQLVAAGRDCDHIKGPAQLATVLLLLVNHMGVY